MSTRIKNEMSLSNVMHVPDNARRYLFNCYGFYEVVLYLSIKASNRFTAQNKRYALISNFR